jgi:hypothetical protein
MKKILVTPALTAALLASSLLAAAPAVASGVVLPSNANGTDNSGIQAIVCKNSVHMRLPVTQNTDPNAMVPGSGSNHIHLTGASLDFNKNAASDELRLAFSVVSKDVAESVQPSRVKILVEFADSDDSPSQNYAQFQVDIENGTGDGQQDFANNRYVVATKTLEQLAKSPSFTWNSVNVIKIWASVEDSSGDPDSRFYVVLDALRLENVTTKNPLYGMSGYSVVRSANELPIVKVANTANLVEFRFALDVDLDLGNVS